MFMAENHITFLFIVTLRNADLAEPPSIELPGKRGKLSFAKEVLEGPFYKLVSIPYDEGMPVVSPRNASSILISRLRILSLLVNKHQHQL